MCPLPYPSPCPRSSSGMRLAGPHMSETQPCGGCGHARTLPSDQLAHAPRAHGVGSNGPTADDEGEGAIGHRGPAFPRRVLYQDGPGLPIDHSAQRERCAPVSGSLPLRPLICMPMTRCLPGMPLSSALADDLREARQAGRSPCNRRAPGATALGGSAKPLLSSSVSIPHVRPAACQATSWHGRRKRQSARSRHLRPDQRLQPPDPAKHPAAGALDETRPSSSVLGRLLPRGDTDRASRSPHLCTTVSATQQSLALSRRTAPRGCGLHVCRSGQISAAATGWR